MNLDKKQSAFPQEYYGDDPRWFIATVIDSRPLPETKLIGRVQIRIHGVHSPFLSDIPQADLPWAQVVMPPTTGGTSGLGSTLRIEAGSLVFGIFLDGKHSQEPLVMGTIPHYEYQSPVQGGTQSGFEQPKINKESARDGDTSADITSETRENRQNEGLKHFMANGFSQAQAARQQDIANQFNLASAQQGLGGFQANLGQSAQQAAGTNISRLGSLGALNQAQAQAEADAAREAARQAAFLPQQNLDRYAAQVTGIMGGYPGQTTLTATPNPTPLQSALGIGTTLAGIYGAIKNPSASDFGRIASAGLNFFTG